MPFDGAEETPGPESRGWFILTRGLTVRAGFLVRRAIVTAGLCSALAACSAGTRVFTNDVLANLVPPRIASPETASNGATPAASEDERAPVASAGFLRAGSPHTVAGESNQPGKNANYDQVGMASWYGSAFHGRETANGESFDRNALSAAHPTMPLPSYVRVTNLGNNRSVIVRVNDRGPYRHNRLIDVSEQTAELLAFRRHGLTRVRIQYVSDAPLDGDDKEVLLASYHGPAGARAAVAAAQARSAVAFTTENGESEAVGRGAARAMQTLTASYEASDRILMAFDVAARVED